MLHQLVSFATVNFGGADDARFMIAIVARSSKAPTPEYLVVVGRSASVEKSR